MSLKRRCSIAVRIVTTKLLLDKREALCSNPRRDGRLTNGSFLPQYERCPHISGPESGFLQLGNLCRNLSSPFDENRLFRKLRIQSAFRLEKMAPLTLDVVRRHCEEAMQLFVELNRNRNSRFCSRVVVWLKFCLLNICGPVIFNCFVVF
ncbi:hypothetical protein Y032_0151g2830 [Ancylostoma ceylanicum]|uniref:Uncharacterized protein n=1 Tax=Ancylostoma ceylanicum TaxID=53326 RepID=A0A016T153_9BILA|nr:hypothetical protein Y032_0151g2830 [Ancylostoma ceylanicum]